MMKRNISEGNPVSIMLHMHTVRHVARGMPYNTTLLRPPRQVFDHFFFQTEEALICSASKVPILENFPDPQDKEAITAPSMATKSSSTCRRPEKSSQTPLPKQDSLLLPDLLPEIIVEILLRLPVKFLLRFRCVSKSWRSLISQPKFARTHLSLALMNTDYTPHRLILSCLYPRSHFKSCSLYSILNGKSDTAVELDCPLEVGQRTSWIVGCCNGFVCIAAGREFSLWNPSTRKSKRIPSAEIPYHYSSSYGFGYDKSVDDYKVVGISLRPLEIEVKVYTLRTNLWRRIESFPHCLPSDNSGIYLNGALHWIVSRESNILIVSLDLAKETYGEVLVPDYPDDHVYRGLLDVLNGCLCILCASDDSADLWVMKEYGIRESWTKLVVIPYATHPLFGAHPEPVCILRNGEVLVNVLTHLVRYNPKDGTSIIPTIHNGSEGFTVFRYVESLVSPDADADSGVTGVQCQHQD